MTDDAKVTITTPVDCTVIHKATADDLIVETKQGDRYNVSSVLPHVNVGTKGRLIPYKGGIVFLREPYDG